MSEIIHPFPQEKILSGLEISSLPIQTKFEIVNQISVLLKDHQEHMLQFTPQQLLEQFIDTGNTVVAYNDTLAQVVGFAKNYLWTGVNELGKPVYEFGSWIVKPGHTNYGLGHQLALAASKLAKSITPDCQVVALCANDNQKPVKILQELGAFQVNKPNNVNILLQAGKTKMVVLDMTNISNK